MKKILVGIDFSRSADRALAYAEEIALQVAAELQLVFVQPTKGADDQDAADASQRLAKLADSVTSRGITATAETYQGEVASVLKKIIEEGDCDLVVMGCQGENFLPNNPWGSTTTTLMEDTRIPVLAVPSYAPVKYPRRFLLATDAVCPTRKRQLLPLLTLLEADRTELLLFHDLQATEAATPHQDYARLLEGIPYRFYYQVDNHQPIGHVVVDFAELTASDLVVVTHREVEELGVPGKRSVAQLVTWSSSVPVLVLQASF